MHAPGELTVATLLMFVNVLPASARRTGAPASAASTAMLDSNADDLRTSIMSEPPVCCDGCSVNAVAGGESALPPT